MQAVQAPQFRAIHPQPSVPCSQVLWNVTPRPRPVFLPDIRLAPHREITISRFLPKPMMASAWWGKADDTHCSERRGCGG